MQSKHASRDLYCIGHWYNLHDVEKKYGHKYLIKNNIKLINLIRHPIDRTHSNWHNLRTAFSKEMPEDHIHGFYGPIKKQKSWLYRFLKEQHISLQNTEEATFIGACLNLFACSVDAGYQKYQHVKIESLNNEALIRLIKNMSEGSITLEEEQIEKMQMVRNSHVASYYQKPQDNTSDAMTTHEKYLSWLPWQQEFYKLCVLKSKLKENYQKFEYELYV